MNEMDALSREMETNQPTQKLKWLDFTASRVQMTDE